MNEEQIQKVTKILSDWNPLGDRAANISDLEGYRTEAIDILFQIYLRSIKTEPKVLNIVRTVLNETFDLSLNNDECFEASKSIFEIVKNN